MMASLSDQPLLHATGICINGHAIALLGKSGSGKSDLALRLIDRGATLIGDDYLKIIVENDAVTVCPVDNILNKLEVRGIGITEIPSSGPAVLALCIVLDKAPERLPFDFQTINVAGYDIPAIALSAFEASAVIKVELALKAATV